MSPPQAEGRLLQFQPQVKATIAQLDPEAREEIIDALKAIRDNPSDPDGIEVVLDRIPDGEAFWVADLPMQYKAVYRVVYLRSHDCDAVNVLSLRPIAFS